MYISCIMGMYPSDKNRGKKSRKKMYLAHISEDKLREQSIIEHAKEVAKLGGMFAACFDCGEWGDGCGSILDEPTAAMDVETTFLSENLIWEYAKKSGCVLLLITHSLQQAKRIADEILFFHKGQLFESGPKERLLFAPTRPETRQFLEFYGI